MNVQLTPDLQAEVEKFVVSGHYKNADDAVAHGIRLLLTAEGAYEKVKVGIDQANRGELVDHNTVFSNLRSKLST
jgi:antitoxin ParD1/3/4